MSIHSHTYFTVVIIIYNTGQYEISITLMQCLPIYVDVYANRKDIYIFKIILTIFYLSEILLLMFIRPRDSGVIAKLHHGTSTIYQI